MAILGWRSSKSAKEPPLRDFLCVDEKRLDSYMTQIKAPTPVDKVPIWEGEISITGVKVVGKQQTSVRTRKNEEGIELLLAYLRKNDQLVEGRIRDANYFNHPPVFRIETCPVVSVTIPLSAGHESGADAITLWVSSDEVNETGRLFLLEDSKKGDEPGFGASSAYSSLLMLYREVLSGAKKHFAGTPRYDESLVAELRQKELGRVQRQFRANRLRDEAGPYSRHNRFDSMSLGPEGLYIEVDKRVDKDLEMHSPLHNPNEPELQRRFAVEPVRVLEEMGARIGGRRMVETLYRLREVHAEPLPDGAGIIIVTFGYPIFIATV
jgi:hypothetical protein